MEKTTFHDEQLYSCRDWNEASTVSVNSNLTSSLESNMVEKILKAVGDRFENRSWLKHRFRHVGCGLP